MLNNIVFLLAAATLLTAASANLLSSSGVPDAQWARDEAQIRAAIGHNQLHLNRLSDAQANCDAALKIDPANGTAKECLDLVAKMLVDGDLNEADAKRLSRDNAGAIALASKWAVGGAQGGQQIRAQRIIRAARSTSLEEHFLSFVPAWLRQILVTIMVFIFLALLLLGARRLRREWKRGEWYGGLSSTTKWRMLPLKEIPGAADEQTGVPTDAVLDAFSRLGQELERALWQPKLLLLRPTPPANHEPAIIDGFLSDSLCDVLLAPATGDLRFQWRLHDVELDQAVRSLQLKTANGIDVGSVARLIRSVFDWFNVDAPSISGVAKVGSDNAVSIHLFARGGRIGSVAVSASTADSPGIDPVQLSAERAAFKFLFRMQYPAMTNDEIDGFSALRQGATEFAQYAGTVPSVGDDAKSRESSLAHAALNLGYFRASIPPHCAPPNDGIDRPSLTITDEIRQAVLLAEGVARSLVGGERNYMYARDCFRQLQDWPGSLETLPLRQQAAYNEAIVSRELGSLGQCVLMLTALLGERAPDTVEPGSEALASKLDTKSPLPEAIRFPARVARLAALAKYDRSDWEVLPSGRSKLVIDDAELLVQELLALSSQTNISAHERRLVRYMYVETLRAIGHAELFRMKTGPASRLYEGARPTGLRRGSLNDNESQDLRHAINWMLTCERLEPDCNLYCDLAESYLLLKEFETAAGYARHATLKRKPEDERAYYLATESFLLWQTDASRALAKKYADDFHGPVTLEEFKSARAELYEISPVSFVASSSA
jgi:tetratricopeptide (TPR) repeat protein